jgi:lipoprotein-anchoring transpeptidase ErfK/SrfK
VIFRPLFGVAAGALALIGAAFVQGTGSDANAAAQTVQSGMGYSAGTVVIVNSERKLYYMLGNGKAIRYPIAVGKPSQVWTGSIRVSKKKENPDWLNPDDPTATPVPGGPKNPLGVRALYLGDTLYRIHGTPKKSSIGSNVSNGCIRMLNSDVVGLYKKVKVGAKVVAINSKSSAPRAGAPKPVNMSLYLKDKARVKKLAAVKLKRARRIAEG